MAGQIISAGVVDIHGNRTSDSFQIDPHNRTMTMRDESGQVVTMDLGIADVHTDAALANIAFGFKLPNSCADTFSPVYPTDKASNYYNVWDKDDVLQPVTDAQLIVAPGDVVPEVGPRLNRKQFATKVRALATVVPTELEQNADAPLNVKAAAVYRLMNIFAQAREIRVATLLQATANWDASAFYTTLGATAKWNAGSTSDPMADLDNALEQSLMPVTGICMSRRTYNAFTRNAKVQSFIQFKSEVPGLPSPEEVNNAMALKRLPPITVSDMKYKSAASTYSYVWGNDVVLVHSGPPTASQQEVTTSATFRWMGGQTPDEERIAQAGKGFIVRSYFDQRRGPKGSTVIVVTHADAEVMVSGSVGGLIKAAWQ